MGLSTVYHGSQGGASPDGTQAGQIRLTEQMEGLSAAKQVDFCLYRIGEIGGLPKPPVLGDYWPAFKRHEPAAVQMAPAARRLAAEVEALERMGTMARHGLTARGKLWIYGLAVDRMLDATKYPSEELARMCTWEDFRRLFAAQVAALCDEDTKWQAELKEKQRQAAGSGGAGQAKGGGGA